jgi:tRNA A-37 threonylcarbamoyl transferase component Bud32
MDEDIVKQGAEENNDNPERISKRKVLKERIQSYYRLPYIVWMIIITATRAKYITCTEELPAS